MKLKEIHDAYYGYSSQASLATRTLSFGGIAAVWLIGGGINTATGKLKIPGLLIAALLIFIVALALDWAHYVVAAAIWGSYGRIIEHRLSKAGTPLEDDAEAGEPHDAINWAPLLLFWSKVAIVGPGYALVAIYLLCRLR